MALVFWSFEKPGSEELYTISTGRVPPAEDDLIKNWKPLETGVEATEEGISKITYERPAVVLGGIERQEYHTFQPKLVRPDWICPSRRGKNGRTPVLEGAAKYLRWIASWHF
jgi:hypothetical protein